ncbi:MAG TPA: gliding motility-associated C-terminal domain-containing protein, partial [Saprospiraceae bacterium]|nr:gliding motility-associated C-terminal domain-containing protein [Saprospiraceae bacterium]
QTGEFILFKIDSDGDVEWAKIFLGPITHFSNTADRGEPQLIEVGNQLVFTGYTTNQGDGEDLLIIRTDLNGEVHNLCVENENVSIAVTQINNPTFYNVTPDEFSVEPEVKTLIPKIIQSNLMPREECVMTEYLIGNIQVSICINGSYEGYTIPGFYQDTFVTAAGCDSIRILDLSFGLPASFADVAICEGGSFEGYTDAGFYIDTIEGILNSCDTIRHLTITVTPALLTFINHSICEGQSFLGYSTTGIYMDTFQNVEGCDSIRILNLNVGNEIVTNDFIQICLGDSFSGHSVSGIYMDTVPSSGGCDSINILTIEVTAIEKNMEVEICSGKSFENYSSTGFYIDTLPGIASPCDTIRRLNLQVLAQIQTTAQHAICFGDTYFGHADTGQYIDTLVSVKGCDSIRTLILNTIDQSESYIESSVCNGFNFGHSGVGTFIDTLISQSGCDSIRTLVLTGGSKYIPNVFSPNDDGLNDVFTIFQFPDHSLNLQYFAIFDRFGDMTYETNQWPIEWDGRAHGQQNQTGVFTYVLIYICGEKRIVEHGDITMLK